MIFLVLLFDVILGDPRNIGHSTVWIGYLVSFLEKFLYKKENAIYAKILGGLLVLLVVSIVGTIAYIAECLILHYFQKFYAILIISFLASFTIAFRSLITHILPIIYALVGYDIVKARKALSMIVGRSTENLSRSEISRAAIEALAESLGDGILSPIFFFSLFSLPGAFVYRAINTMDSMLGYKNEKYINFGFFAAKLDDIANYFPVRLLGIPSLILSGLFIKGKIKLPLKTIFIDQSSHSSPNAGWLEALTAYILDIRLGGKNIYKNKVTETAIFNKTGKRASVLDIKKTIYLITIATIISLGIATICSNII